MTSMEKVRTQNHHTRRMEFSKSFIACQGRGENWDTRYLDLCWSIRAAPAQTLNSSAFTVFNAVLRYGFTGFVSRVALHVDLHTVLAQASTGKTRPATTRFCRCSAGTRPGHPHLALAKHPARLIPHRSQNEPRLPLYLCLFLLTLIPFAGTLSTILLGAKPSSDELARGQYLVEEVARCSDCHTPRDASGNWADHAPPLAGLPSFADAQMENLLEKGLGPNGETLRPPMHRYHLDREDARAIIAYLQSLTPAKR